MNMYKLLEQTVAKYPDNLYLVRENVSYKEFLNLVKARASTLDTAGVKKGDVVGVLSHNIPEFPITMFALWYLGATVLLLDTNLTPYEYDNMAEIADCKMVCAEKSFVYKTDKFKFFDINKKDGKVNPDLKPADVETLDVATMSFTSGSTGVPKVVPLTHFNLTECANSLEDMAEWFKPGDYLYGFLPMYHVFGFAVEILATLHFGAGVIYNQRSIQKKLWRTLKNSVPRLSQQFHVCGKCSVTKLSIM